MIFPGWDEPVSAALSSHFMVLSSNRPGHCLGVPASTLPNFTLSSIQLPWWLFQTLDLCHSLDNSTMEILSFILNQIWISQSTLQSSLTRGKFKTILRHSLLLPVCSWFLVNQCYFKFLNLFPLSILLVMFSASHLNHSSFCAPSMLSSS